MIWANEIDAEAWCCPPLLQSQWFSLWELTAVAVRKFSTELRKRSTREILADLARALARQAAREDAAAELAKERAAPCELPSTPVSAPISRTSDRL